MKIMRAASGRLAQVAAVGALAAVAGLAGGLAAGPVAGGSPVAGKAAPATAWRVQTPPEPAGTTDQAFGAVSCSSSSACLAIAGNDYPRGVGGFGETWNGLHWTVRTVPDGKAADDLEGVACRSAQWCVAVGSKASGNGFVPVADRWNGAAWKIQPLPAPPGGGLLHAVACPAPSACRAVGSDDKGLFSEVWNGAAWVIRPVPVPAGGSFAGLNGVSCTAAASCEAVGSYEKDGTFRSLAEVWTGSRWLLQAPSAGPGATSSQLNAVSCVSATDCEAAGDAQTTATGQAGILEKWNGTNWTVQEKVLPAGDTSARLSGISCTTGPVCEAVGYHGVAAYRDHVLALRYSS